MDMRQALVDLAMTELQSLWKGVDVVLQDWPLAEDAGPEEVCGPVAQGAKGMARGTDQVQRYYVS